MPARSHVSYAHLSIHVHHRFQRWFFYPISRQLSISSPARRVLAVNNSAPAATIFVDTAKPEHRTLRGSSDGELVRGVLAGEKATYGLLYDCFAPLVRAVCED